MSLLELQTAFRAEIVGGDEDAAPSSLGMGVYRDAYRARLLAALEASFERTRRWVGAEAFTAAACHYVLANPPRNWTLDTYGADFPALLEALFVSDPEVAELAWLEWQMQAAFAAPDRGELDLAALAAAGYSDDDWDRLHFTMAPGFAARSIATNVPALWEALEDCSSDGLRVERSEGNYLLVWRHSLSPRFRVTAHAEFQALGSLARHDTLGSLAQATDTQHLALWLEKWLREGLFADSSLL